METKDAIRLIRENNNMTQEEFAVLSMLWNAVAR